MITEIDVGSLVTSRLRLLYRSTELGVGTGFFYELNGQFYLVTNWHVVSGRNFQTLECILANGGLPDRLKFTVWCDEHFCEWREIDWMLYEDAVANQQPEKPTWLEHAVNRHNIDVVAIPITLPEDAVVLTAGDYLNTVPTMSLKVARDVFVLGYPKGISGGGVFPIWKKASIATEPAIQLDGLPKILVDTATREGMSGAPVVAIADGTIETEDGGSTTTLGRFYRFVGVYSGRLGNNEMEAQLGIVWKAQAVDEIVQVPTKGKSNFAI